MKRRNCVIAIMPVHGNKPCEDGKHIFGTVKVGERGQIVIPKEAREIFGIKPGDSLMVLGDEKQGIALVRADKFRSLAAKMLKIFDRLPAEPDDEE